MCPAGGGRDFPAQEGKWTRLGDLPVKPQASRVPGGGRDEEGDGKRCAEGQGWEGVP